MKNTLLLMKTKLRSRFTDRKKRCSGTILIMIMVFVIVTFSVVVGEFYRMHTIQQEAEYQLQRAVNCAVEYAMGDSYRQDKIINLNVPLAKNEFYKYIKSDMGLDSYNRKFVNGRHIYTMYITSVDGTSNPAVFTAKGKLEANSIFSFLVGTVEVPFKVSSTNYRLE